MSSGPQLKSMLSGLSHDPLIREYDVLKYEHILVKFHLKLQIEFVDQSVLYTNEYLGNAVRKDAFHWQQTNKIWLVRWDNAPYFPLLISFPHHKHEYRQGSEIITDSTDIALTDVLGYIKQQLAVPPQL